MIERRRAARRDVAVILGVPGEPPARLTAHQLGTDCVLLNAGSALPEGTSVALELALEDRVSAVRCRGEVVWTGLARGDLHPLGIEFRDLEEADAQRIAALVEAHHHHVTESLRQFPAFDALPEEALEDLCELCFRRTIRKGDAFFREGQEGNTLFVIEHGTVRITRRDADGEDRLIAVASSGEVFGEVSLVTGQPHGATVTAIVDTRVLGMTQDAYEFLKWRHPKAALAFAEVLMRFLCTRLGRTTRKLHAPAPLKRRP